MDCRIPGFLVLHYLPEFAETTVQWADDAVQPSHPLSLLFSSCPQYFPIRVFSSELLLASGSQSIGASGSASVLPITIQGRFPLGLTGLISLQHDGLAIVFAKTTVQKATLLWCSTFFMVYLSHPDRSTGETIAWTMSTFVSKVMYMFFKTLCRFVLAFLPRSKCLLISWLQSPSTVILEPKKIKLVTVSILSLSIWLEVMNWMPWTWCFQRWGLSQLFHSPLSASSRGSFVTLLFLPFSSVQLLSRAQFFVTPMDYSMPGLPLHHLLPEFALTCVHQNGDAIQPSHPLPSASPPAFILSQHQGLFQWVSSLHEVAKVLAFQLQHESIQWIFGLISFRMDWLDLLAL